MNTLAIVYLLVLGLCILLPFILQMWVPRSPIAWRDSILEIFNSPTPTIFIVLFALSPVLLGIFGFDELFLSQQDDILSISLFSLSVVILFSYLRSIVAEKKNVIKERQLLQAEIKKIEDSTTNLESVAHKLMDYNTHPIIATKTSFKKTTEKLFSLNSLKEIALEFAIDSLEQISSKAYVKIDTKLSEYTRKLSKFITKSNKEIVGTYTLRPKIIYQQKQDVNQRQEYIEYLKIFKEKNIPKKRIVVFELEEVNAILEDAIYQKDNNGNFILISGRSKSPRNRKVKLQPSSSNFSQNRLPEIKWFEDEICCDNTSLKWTLTSVFLNHLNLQGNIKNIIQPDGSFNYMSDFAIFDDEILVTWRESNPKFFSNSISEPVGTLLMNWSGSTNYISGQIEQMFDQNNNLSLIEDTFDDLLVAISNIKIDDSTSLGLRESSLKKFQRLYSEMKNHLSSGLYWSNTEY